MAKFLLRIRARKMRALGESVKVIAKKLGVSKGTASLWVRDIILSVEQYETLKKRSIKGGEKGRMLGAFMQKQRRLDLIKHFNEEGIRTLNHLSKNQLFVCGVALYWAEGNKKSGDFCICNSDPKMLILMIKWLKTFFGINISDLVAVVGINQIHRKRENIVKEYWAKETRIPLNQFRKTSFKKAKVNKVYENYNEHYGTLRVEVLKPARIYYRILGLVEGLSQAGVNFKPA